MNTRSKGRTILAQHAESFDFFFLGYGRSRSEARSLHEKKQLLRKLLHGHRWPHAAGQIITTKTQNTNQNKKARRRSPSQICVSPSKGQQSKQRTGQEPNRNNHKRFAQDTVVTTHCVATDSKTCSKRISCHPVKRDARSTLLPRRKQKIAFAIHCRLAQPLRVLSRELGHVLMFRISTGTNRHKPEQEKDDIGDQVSLVPLPIAGSGSAATTMRSSRAR